jgi:hypothetical protein
MHFTEGQKERSNNSMQRTALRVMGPLGRPITRLEPTRAPASPLARAPPAQPPLR